MILQPGKNKFSAMIDVDLANDVEVVGDELRAALATHKVLVARNQVLSPDNFETLAESIGVLERHVLSDYHLTGHPDIMLLSNRIENGRAVGISDAGRIWHSDTSFRATPPIATMLYGIELPPTGGDTHFIDMGRVYRELPSKLKAELHGVKGIFSYLPSYLKKMKENPKRRPLTQEEISNLGEVKHDILCRHPETYEDVVFANEAHTVSLVNYAPIQGSAILQELFQICYRDGPDYVHRWKNGDVIIWDNRSVIHKATEYDPKYVRHLWRISISA